VLNYEFWSYVIKPGLPTVRTAAVLALIGSCSLACSDRSARSAANSRPVSTRPAESETSNAWANQVGHSVLPKSAPTASEVKIEPAILADNGYAGHDLVTVRRLVYRVTLQLPDTLRPRPPVLAPAGELSIDIGEERLRARFLGPGWPVDEGSEVRLRGDIPGVYLFDGDGGRPLGPGKLARWFQGDESVHGRVDVRVATDPNAVKEEGPGELLCAFLAEWGQIPREYLLPSCAGSLPPGFRFGPWSAELSAIVPLSLPRSQLRADALAPPDPLSTSNSHALFEPRDLIRITPTPLRAVPGEAAALDAAVSGNALAIDNRTPSRVAVVVQGVVIGWVKPQQVGSFQGLTPGYYRVAALRPLGTLALPVTFMRVPAEVVLGKLVESQPAAPAQPAQAAPGAQLSEPLLNSPDAAR
jgi:hypothetical protein